MKNARLISLYEVIGGIVGLGFSTYFLYSIFHNINAQLPSSLTPRMMGFLLLQVGTPLLIFNVTAIISGLLLWRMKLVGKILSMIFLLLQISILTVSGFRYFVSLGLGLIAVAHSTASQMFFGFNFELSPQLSLGFHCEERLFGINITPMILLMVLSRVHVGKPGE
jgi:hypothetical protein